ncbi:hypothetical protein OH77DRAFT_1292 [Trametes cingulata]|nr:hypothetical protein OH77DRAFT_1292 [Trametes cingulata]
MPKCLSCRNCRPKKVKCVTRPGEKKCQRCADKDLQCVRPPRGKGAGRGTRSTACNYCRKHHMACELVEGAAVATCVECLSMRQPCSLSQPGPAATNQAGPSEGTSAANNNAPQEASAATTQQAASGEHPAPQAADTEPAANAPQTALVIDTAPATQDDSGATGPSTAATSPTGSYWETVLNSPSPGGSDSSRWRADDPQK